MLFSFEAFNESVMCSGHMMIRAVPYSPAVALAPIGEERLPSAPLPASCSTPPPARDPEPPRELHKAFWELAVFR